MVDQNTIGERIRKAREDKGMNQDELGKKIGYSAMGISYLEKGLRKTKVEDIEKIADALEVSMSYLLEPVTKQTYPNALYRRGEEDINDDQQKAEKDALKKLDELIKSMK